MWRTVRRPAHHTKWICSCVFLGWKKYLVFCGLVFSSTYRHRNNCVPSGCFRSPVKTWRSVAPRLPLLHQWQPWAGLFFSYSEELPFLQVCDHLEYECVCLWWLCAFVWSEVVGVLMYECIYVYTFVPVYDWVCGCVTVCLWNLRVHVRAYVR